MCMNEAPTLGHNPPTMFRGRSGMISELSQVSEQRLTWPEHKPRSVNLAIEKARAELRG